MFRVYGEAMRARREPETAPVQVTAEVQRYVVPRPNRPTVDGAGNAAVQRMVDSFEQATTGSATALPHRARMEADFGRDFGHVRAFTGRGLDGLDAVAAAYGSRVAFAETDPSPAVVAHELGHVVQHDGKSLPARPRGVSDPTDAAERSATADADAVIHRLVTSAGGTWTTPTYAPVNQGNGVGKTIGASIKLHFTANNLVEAPQIGLSQTVHTMKSTAPGAAADTPANARQIPDYLKPDIGVVDVGRGIDRRDYGVGGGTLPNTNPLYGVYNTAAVVSQTLGDVAASQNTNATGSHTRQANGTFNPPVDAVLDDRPNRTLAFAGERWEQRFEVTALAISGPLAGTYLGSVAWGWHTDSHDNAKLDPPQIVLVREGPPTTAFMDAAYQWNQMTLTDTTTGTNYNTVDLPMDHDVAELTTENLAVRLVALRAEANRLPAADPAKAHKNFQAVVYARELAKRSIDVFVKVKKTEDRSTDNVYAKIFGPKKYKTKVTDMSAGDEHDFLISIGDVATTLPLPGSPLAVEVWDEDLIDPDDKLVAMTWTPGQGPAVSKKSMDGADYYVHVNWA